MQLGVVEALAASAVEALHWRISGLVDMETSNRVVFNLLGAMGMLAVDGLARERCTKVCHAVLCIGMCAM